MTAQQLLAGATICSLSLCAPRTSSAQTTADRPYFAAAVTFTRLPQVNPDRPGDVFPSVVAPYGNSPGFQVFGGVGLWRRLAVGGELSVASPATLTRQESHPSENATRTIQHRDTVLSGLLSVRTGRFVHFLAGGGVVFPRTSLTVSGHYVDFSSSPVTTISYGPLFYDSPTNGARFALTVGADLSAPLNDHVAFTGVVRLHHLSRAEPLHSDPFGRSNDPRPFLQPDSHTFRLGVGVRLSL
jgi:hypothetical protein